MVDAGNSDKSKKLSSDQMQEQLRLWYPKQLAIPTTHHINSYVTSYRSVNQDDEDAGAGMEDGEDTCFSTKTRKVQYRTTLRYVMCLCSIIQGNIHIPEPSLETAVNNALNIVHDTRPADFPTVKQIISKETSLSANFVKKRGVVPPFVFPALYAVTLETLVRENGKIKW